MQVDCKYAERLHYLDSLKGIAMLLVIAVHCINDNLGDEITAILGNGRHGVQLFFVMTGLLTALSMNKISISPERTLRLKTVQDYFFRKIQKIIPAYYFTIFFILFINGLSRWTGYEYLQQYWLGAEEQISIFNIMAHLFFINGFIPHYINSIIGVEWYIADVAIFYIVYILFIRKYCDKPSVLVKVILGAIIVTYIIKYVDRNYIRCVMTPGVERVIIDSYINTFNFFAQFPCMLFGVFINNYYTEGANIKGHRFFGIMGWSLFILMLLNILHITESLMDVLYGLAASFIIIGMRWEERIWIDNRVLRYIGRNSLEFYLVHLIIVDIWNKYCYQTLPVEDVVVQYIIKYFAVTVMTLVVASVLREVCKPVKRILQLT